LEKKSTEYLEFRLKIFEDNINNPDPNSNISFLFNDIIQGADYPIIYTDKNRHPQSWKNIPGLPDNKTELTDIELKRVNKFLKEIARENKPIAIRYRDNILGYYYYGYSPVIYKLKKFPLIAVGAALIFILLGYLGFSYVKRSEQQFIWIGMAKETAHQLGTPLSSIAGWLELMKQDDSNKDLAIREIENDMKRLNKVATRFSKIGSASGFKMTPITDVISDVIKYFQKRLPNMHKKIVIREKFDCYPLIDVNPELFEWVIENLIKNSIDAIENKNEGEITIRVHENAQDGKVYVDCIDNGKGVLSQQRKNIFQPGFSTKKRGWGLGLSLAKRIIEDYHHGKIYLKDSKPNKGTIIRIVLNA
jgi:two-component sensor histidine kinase